jgi:hypothetical protein
MASALEKGLQLASRILQASWLELIYDPLVDPYCWNIKKNFQYIF